MIIVVRHCGSPFTVDHRLSAFIADRTVSLGQFLRLPRFPSHVIDEKSRADVHQISGRKWNDDFDWPLGLSLREDAIA
jgi:hypothetical protein